MAKKKGKKRTKRQLWLLRGAVALVICVACLAGASLVNTSTLLVRRAVVTVADLPGAFEGKTILYLSDIDLCGINTSSRAADAIHRLQALKPDILLLGGDYTSTSLLDLLDRTGEDDDLEKRRSACRDLFQYISDFEAPLGRFAVISPDDGDAGWMRGILTGSGFRPLIDEAARIELGGEALWLAGICEASGTSFFQGRGFSRDECVICTAYGPACFPAMMIHEATSGGPWFDLALAGHTHGGQIRLFGASALSLNEQEQHYLHGWTREAGIPMLTTSGLGCEGVNLRLGSRAEVWLIQLTAVPSPS